MFVLVVRTTVVVIQQCYDCTNRTSTLLVLAQSKRKFCPGI